MKRFITSIVCISVLSLFYANCQNATQVDTTKIAKQYEITLNDGSSLIGSILSRDSTTIVFQTSSISRIEIPVQQMKSLKEIVPGNTAGGYSIANPFPTKYFFTQSAINLHKGEGYYQNTYLFFNSVNYGFTDYFSVGAGIEVLSTFGSLTAGGKFSPIFYIAPKVGFKVAENLHLGAGVTLANISDFFDNTVIGLGSGLATYGSTEHNVTLGLGTGFSFENKYVSNLIYSVSGMTRVSNRIALVSENYIFPADNGYYTVFSYGMRFIANKISVDLGFINNKDIIKGIFIGIPYIDFNVKFK